MIINIGESKISLKQNSNGFWYVNDLSISGNNIMKSIDRMDAAMYKTEMLLDKYNNVDDSKVKSKVKKLSVRM